MPYKFSPSSLSILKDCPRCFWLQFRKGLCRPQGIFPSLPSGMDRILKAHFDSYMKKGELPPSLSKLQGEVMLFDDEELLKRWRSNFTGISWTDEEGNILHGAIDNVLRKGNKLIVLDYKTRGFPLKDDTAAHYQEQLDIYNFLFRQNGHITEDYSYLLFYHPDKVAENGDIIFHTDLVKLKTDAKNALTILKHALEVLGVDTPPPAAKGCEYCRHREYVA